MTDDVNDQHQPTPEFRASLKREIRRAYRADRQFDPPPAGTRRSAVALGLLMGAVVTLPIGLVLGARTGYASAAELNGQQRESAATSIATRHQFAAARLEMARANYDALRRELAEGKTTAAALRAAKTEVDSMEANVARVDLDLEASRTTTPAPRSGLAILRSIPRSAFTALTCSAVAAGAQTSPAQQGIPVVNLTPVSAKTTTTLGAVLGVRELPGGRLLVNDAGRRQIMLFDSTFAKATVALDSAAGGSNSYGPRAANIMPYFGDSTLLTEIVSLDVLVLGGSGHVARALAPPTFENGDLPFAVRFPAARAADNKGRLIAQSGFRVRMNPVTHMGEVADSALVLRADLETRQVEVVGALHTMGGKNKDEPPENGKRVVTTFRQPVPTEDSWSVLSDGTIAFVRGQDYHVDWLLPDGTKSATTKLPFDWKRLTDEDKQKLADSARVVWDSLMTLRNARNAGPATGRGGDAGGGGGDNAGRGRSSGGVGEPGSSQGGSIQRMVSVPLSEIPDYYPPINQRSSMPDRDGNLWILPTTSAQSQHGELVYDVVNVKQGLFQRVRMPVGRSIAGFGKGGVVYLQSGDRTNGFYLERAKLEVRQK